MTRRTVYLGLVILGGGLAVLGWRDGDGGDIAWGCAAVVAGGLLAIFDGKGRAE